MFTDLLSGERVALHRAYLPALVGEVFGRPSTLVLPWLAADAEPDSDMWATADETQAEIIELHQRSAAHSDATIESLPLDAPGEVPWWPLERRRVRQQQILIHMYVETARQPATPTSCVSSSTERRETALTTPMVASRSAEERVNHRARIKAAAQEAARSGRGVR